MLLIVTLGSIAIGVLPLLMGWVEDRVVSPQALIRATVRSGPPELTEWIVAQEAERLLGRSHISERYGLHGGDRR